MGQVVLAAGYTYICTLMHSLLRGKSQIFLLDGIDQRNVYANHSNAILLNILCKTLMS